MRRVLLPLAELTARQLAGSDPLVGGSGCVTWHSVYESTGSATASYELSDGAPGQNQQLMYVTLLAGQSTRDYIGLHCLPFITGLYFDKLTGSLGGTITAYVDHICEDYLHTEHLFYRTFDLAVYGRPPTVA